MSKEVNIIEESHRVANYIEKEGLNVRSRKRELVYRRAYLFAYMRHVMNYTYSQIGMMFGRDHATVLHAVSKVHDYYHDDKLYIMLTERERELFPMDTSVLFNRTSNQVSAHLVISENSYAYLNRIKVIHKLEDIHEATEMIIQGYKNNKHRTIIDYNN